MNRIGRKRNFALGAIAATLAIALRSFVIDGRKRRTKGGFLVVSILLASCLIISLSQSGQAQDAVLDWNAHAVNAIVVTAKKPAPQALIRFAMVHAAIYDAVNAIEGYPFERYAVTPQVVSPSSPEAAAAAAAHDVLVALLPDQQADLDTKYAASLAAIADGPAKTNGISVGQQAAAGILSFRANDGRDVVVPYTPGSGPGVWNPTPPGFLPAQTPEAAYIQPFTL